MSDGWLEASEDDGKDRIYYSLDGCPCKTWDNARCKTNKNCWSYVSIDRVLEYLREHLESSGNHPGMSAADINIVVLDSLRDVKTKVDTYRQREKARQDYARSEEKKQQLPAEEKKQQEKKKQSVAKAIQPRAKAAAPGTVKCEPCGDPVAAAPSTLLLRAKAAAPVLAGSKRPNPDTDGGGTVALAKKPKEQAEQAPKTMEVSVDAMSLLRDSLVLSANSIGKASQFLEELNKILKDQMSVQMVAEDMIDKALMANVLQFASSSEE